MELDSQMSFASRVIKHVAWWMVGKSGLTIDDFPDLKQELWLDLLQRLPSYRPDRGSLRGSIRRIVNNKAATMLEARTAAKRGGGIRFVSLNEESEDEDGVIIERHESLSADDYLRRTRGTTRSEGDRIDLALDLRTLLDRLAPSERALCLLLVDRDVCDVANILGIPRTTLRDVIKRLRVHGDAAGLRGYFE